MPRLKTVAQSRIFKASDFPASKTGPLQAVPHADFCQRMKEIRSQNDAPLHSVRRRVAIERTTERYKGLEALKYPSIFLSNAWLELGYRFNWSGTSLTLREFAGKFITNLAKQGVPMYVDEGPIFHLKHARYHTDLTWKEWQYIGILGKQIADKMNAQRLKRDRFDIEWGGDYVQSWNPAYWQLNCYIPPPPDDPAIVHLTPYRLSKINSAPGRQVSVSL